jgi:signal transduction histidine kinase
MFFTAMLGIGFTNSYLSHIDTHTIIESPSMYVWYYLPFIAHMILLAGTFLLEFKVLAEEHQHMSRSFSHAKEKNNSSFLKGMQSEHVNLANKITHSLLNPLTNLNKNHSKTTPQIDGEIKKVLTDLSRIVHGNSADSNDFEWQMQELINAVSTPKKYTLNIFFNDNEVNDNLKNITIRITQEAINNIEKHAQASSVIIECFKSQTYFYLSIADNGVGFDPFQKTDGIGLKNMDKNAAKGNGKFSVTSSPLHGTTLLFSFKLI